MHGLYIQLRELPLAPDYQFSWLKVKKGRGIHLGSFVLPGELLNSTFSLPVAVTPKLLEPCNSVANSGEISLFLIWSWLIR